MTVTLTFRDVRNLVSLLAVFTVLGSAGDEPAPKPFSRANATLIIADARKIVTPNGVERLDKVRIGGIEQWVSIRGADKRNPVLLLIHGGPGYVSMPMSWWFTRGWEEYFTVVQWDQRGAGKTYLLNDPATVGPTMTLERMVADAEEMSLLLIDQFTADPSLQHLDIFELFERNG
jgi:proline iminopeptidase